MKKIRGLIFILALGAIAFWAVVITAQATYALLKALNSKIRNESPAHSSEQIDHAVRCLDEQYGNAPSDKFSARYARAMDGNGYSYLILEREVNRGNLKSILLTDLRKHWIFETNGCLTFVQ